MTTYLMENPFEDDEYKPRHRRKRAKHEDGLFGFDPATLIIGLGIIAVAAFKLTQHRWPWQQAPAPAAVISGWPTASGLPRISQSPYTLGPGGEIWYTDAAAKESAQARIPYMIPRNAVPAGRAGGLEGETVTLIMP